MIRQKFYKNELESQEQLDAYTAAAEWCNTNNATIEDKGDYYEVVPIPEPSLDEVKAAKLIEIKDWTASAITGGFISAGVRYDSDTDTQITMQGICLAVDTPRFAEEYPQGCPVRGYDEGSTEKTIHFLDATAVKLFCADLSAHIGNCKKRGWQLQQAVAAAQTVEDVEKITWTEG